MDIFPLEIIEHILSFLPDRDLVNFLIAERFPPRMYFKFQDDHTLDELIEFEEHLQSGLLTELFLPDLVDLSKITIYTLNSIPKRFEHIKSYRTLPIGRSNYKIKATYIQENSIIRKIPSAINFCSQLHTIHLSDSCHLSLPDLDLPKLISLTITRCQLKKLPKLNLPKLTFLDVSQNELVSVRNLNLPLLSTLFLNDNKISKLINLSLPRLDYLNLKNNSLTQLPHLELQSLRKLKIDKKFYPQLSSSSFGSKGGLYYGNH